MAWGHGRLKNNEEDKKGLGTSERWRIDAAVEADLSSKIITTDYSNSRITIDYSPPPMDSHDVPN
jgi:hypothetical protein